MSHQPGPLVHIANHMSLLETLILPGIVLAFNRFIAQNLLARGGKSRGIWPPAYRAYPLSEL